jgi:hypothetical protein
VIDMRHLILIVMLGAFALVAGCSSAPAKPNGYAAYLDFVGAQQQRADARVAGIAAAAQSCTDARCVENVAALAALASVSGGGAQGPGVAPPPREPSGVEKFAAVAGALSPLAATIVTGAVQWHQADASRDVSIAQYGALDHIVTGAVGGMADVAQHATPSITVGGDYVPGTQTTVGGDVIGRDRIDNSGVIGNENRWLSPNDDHSGDCRDTGTCTAPTPSGP